MTDATATGHGREAGELLMTMERATVAAYKDKDAVAFTRHFADDYIGVANDGVKTAGDEVEGMRALDLRRIGVEDAKASFPAPGVGIVTYTMKASGSRRGTAIDVSIFASTVYVVRDGEWRAALHTESMAPS